MPKHHSYNAVIAKVLLDLGTWQIDDGTSDDSLVSIDVDNSLAKSAQIARQECEAIANAINISFDFE